MNCVRNRWYRRASWRVPVLVIGLAGLGAACGSTSHKAGISGSSTAPTTRSTTSVPATAAPSSTSAPSVSPSSALSSALTGAYQAETATQATYRNVISALGSVGPFPNIASAEMQHVSTVTALLAHYGVTPPAGGAGQASPTTLRAACNLGVTLEQQIIGMYADQIPKVSAYPDVTTAFQNLQAAARDSHLPAFQHCA